jgi:secretion/DNA translocation related TadE-like protein
MLPDPAPRALARRLDRSERGSGTVWMVALIAVVGVFSVFGLALGQAMTARHRAGAAADLAALAAADRALEGPRAACDRARVVAAAHGARLLDCALDGEVSDVRVEIEVPAALVTLAPARVRARAGPAHAPP